MRKQQNQKLKKYSYIIIDDDAESLLETKRTTIGFSELTFVGSASNFQDGLNLVLEHNPMLVFLEINPQTPLSQLSFAFISELYRYLQQIPKIIITTRKTDRAFEAIQYGVFDYVLKPVVSIDIRKLVLKLHRAVLEPQTIGFKEEDEIVVEETKKVSQIIDFKEEEVIFVEETTKVPQNIEKPLIICIKSYGDYRYLNAADICYFQADNNSTDIYLNSGEMITAFKTLKHFESILRYPFIRIHNSYVINRNYISRIHSGNSTCYIKNSTKKIPFSKTYKANVDQIIADFASGNYLEI